MYAIVDIETTGGNPRNSRIIEIAILIHNGCEIIDQFTTLVNPERPIDPFVVTLTGITDEMVSTAPKFIDIESTIFNITKNCSLVAHNARSDYSFLQNEYKRLGKRFQRHHICTVQMSQQIFPGKVSYGLGRLCESLNIIIEDRHRAYGDAKATAILLEKLLQTGTTETVRSFTEDQLSKVTLPPLLSIKDIDHLPEECGVFLYIDQHNKVLYIRKSRNIRNRVIQQLSSESLSDSFSKLKQNIHTIKYELTGNEILSDILEDGLIHKYQPEHNLIQKRKKYRFGISLERDEQGFYVFNIAPIQKIKTPALYFTTKKWAKRSLLNLKESFQITPQLKKECGVKEYNQRVIHAIKHFQFDISDFMIINDSADFNKKSIILVKDGKYFGYGFLDRSVLKTIEDPNEIVNKIKQDTHTPNKDQLIRRFLRKKHKAKITPITHSK